MEVRTQGSTDMSDLVTEVKTLYRKTDEIRDDAGHDCMHRRELDDAVREGGANDQSYYATN